MDDILGLIVVAVIYLIAAAAEIKKKNRKKNARAKGFKSAFDGRQGGEGQVPGRAFAGGEAGVSAPVAHAADCASQPIHLHEVSQRVLHEAGEGEDPCHAGGAPAANEADEAAAQNGEAAMQDLLRGVIMSEILTRPCERRAAERNRRRYHG